MYDMVRNKKFKNKILIIVASEGIVEAREKFDIKKFDSVISKAIELFQELEEDENLYIANCNTYIIKNIECINDIKNIEEI